MQTRRAQLQAVAVGLATLLAGCAGGDDEQPVVETPDDTPTETPESDGPSKETGPYQLESGEYATIVVFRNDDPQPNYETEALEAVEQVFIDAGVPLTHGIIPAVGGEEITPDLPFCERLRELDAAHPGLFEFSVHGYTHALETEAHGGSEFAGMDVAEQQRRIDAGVRIFEDCFDVTPTTFIPPFNSYDDDTVAALVDANFQVVSGGEWFTRGQYGDRQIPFSVDGIYHTPNTHAFVADWESLAFHELETMTDWVEESVENNQLHIQMLHYQYFTSEERLDQLQAFVEHVTNVDGVGCLTLAELGAAVVDGRLERIDNGWHYTQPS